VEGAEQALQKATADIPADVLGRLTSADKLSDDDRKAILEIATHALAPFQPTPKPKPAAAPKSTSKPKPAVEPKPAAKAAP
jgi:F-type H+-transporting ATPase subunit alpha